MSENYLIPDEPGEEQGKTWSYLRSEGLKYIEHLSSVVWTDYNVHDPGVTILELLCYAITDLEYRISLPIEDLLAKPVDNLSNMHEQFLSAMKALPSGPVTADDYRELFVRLDGVQNAWIFPSERGIIAKYRKTDVGGTPELRYLKKGELVDTENEKEFKLQGLNQVLVDFDPSRLPSSADFPDLDEGELELMVMKTKMDIMSQVREVYHRYRNLCEDLDTVSEVPTEGIVVCGEVELDASADPEQVWARIVLNIDHYLSPWLEFYNLTEMQEMGYTSNEIFEGPVFNFDDGYSYKSGKNPFVKKGFIRKDKLKGSGLREEVRLSDIIRIIMDTEGVSIVKDIEFGLCSCDEKDMNVVRQNVSRDKWNLCIPSGHKPVFCIENSVLNFWKGIIPIELKKKDAILKLQTLRNLQRESIVSKVIADLPMPVGTFSDVKKYSTFQNQFPEVYGVGREGLPDSASTERKAQAKQLKAYLLFFDQVLACYFAQLSHAGELLSANQLDSKSYFGNIVQNLKAAEEIFPDVESWIETIEDLFAVAGIDPFVERKNRFLDHLLARFSEQFNEYVFLMYRLYGQDSGKAVIRHKVRFISDYFNVSTFRGSGFDYYNKPFAYGGLDNVTGMEKRLSLLMGINNYHKTLLSEFPCVVYESHVKRLVQNGEEVEVQCFAWKIVKNKKVVLESAFMDFTKKVDAWEESGLAALLGADKENFGIKKDGAKYKVILKNTSGENIAIHPSGLSLKKAEGKVKELVEYFNHEFKAEGLYVVENLLLRPEFDITPAEYGLFFPVCIESNGTYIPPLDPYSFRITIVLPGYGMRLRNKHFRRYVEQLIRMETPAHVMPRICFVNEEMMKKFEDAYLPWLEERTSSPNPERQASKEILTTLKDVIEDLFTVYEEGQLSDCDDDTIEKNPVVLGSSTLGSLEGNSKPDN